MTDLFIFDFDDTLVTTDSHVYVTLECGKTIALTPSEYSVYEPMPGDKFDYRDFEVLINPQPISSTQKTLQHIYDENGPSVIVILTARGTSKPIKSFLKKIGMPEIKVVALGDPDPRAKSSWIKRQIIKKQLGSIKFFDDSYANISAVKELAHECPDTIITTKHIVKKIKRKNQ